MKPKEYVRTFNLDTAQTLSKGFIETFSEEFVTNILFLNEKGGFGYERFKICVEQAKQKYDSIRNKSVAPAESFAKAWNYFYATTVVKLRDSLFGDFLKAKKKGYEAKKRAYEENHRWEREALGEDMGLFARMFQENFIRFLRSLSDSVPHSSFEMLGLTSEASAEEIQAGFKRLALQHHPDKGGDEDTFKALLLAKEKCLAYKTSA